MEKAPGSSDGGQSDRHHPFENFWIGFEEDDDGEGGQGVIGGLAGLFQDHSVGCYKGGGVVPESYHGGEEFKYDHAVDKVDLFPYGVGDPIRAGG